MLPGAYDHDIKKNKFYNLIIIYHDSNSTNNNDSRVPDNITIKNKIYTIIIMT